MKTTETLVTTNQQLPPKLAVTVTEMAELLSISRPYCYTILNREDFSGDFRVGGKRLISVEYLQNWIKNQISSDQDQ